MKAFHAFLLSLMFAIASGTSQAATGKFIQLQGARGEEFRAYVAGPESARAGVLVVHDWFGITDATLVEVEGLAASGYRTIAVDLYSGESAATHEAAGNLMRAIDPRAADRILQAGLDYLKGSGRRIATVGFSMGGLLALNANLNDPQSVAATAIIYGAGFDKIVGSRLNRLASPVLVVSGSRDASSLQSALAYLTTMNDRNRAPELYVYPDADHAYAQPLFNQGRNYDAQATRVTRMLLLDFLSRHLRVERQ